MATLEIRQMPNPQVTPRATRRRFTVADKLRILREADACQEHGKLGVLLRREGIYSSTLASFRKQQEEGKLVATNAPLRANRRKEQAALRQRDRRKIEALEKENRKLLALVDLPKKLSDLMRLTMETSPGDEDR
jgi:transposase-like protein